MQQADYPSSLCQTVGNILPSDIPPSPVTHKYFVTKDQWEQGKLEQGETVFSIKLKFQRKTDNESDLLSS